MKRLGWAPIVWLTLFITAPFLVTFVVSFMSKGAYGGIEVIPTLQNFSRVFDWVYLKIFSQSLKLAILTTSVCLILGFFIAWSMATASEQKRNFLLVLVLIPFLMNLIIRVYAIRTMVAYDGPMMSFLKWLGVEIDPFSFSQNQFLVFYGMVTSYLPFSVFPLYAAFEKFDFTLLEANSDLGGGHWDSIIRILIPGLRPAIISALLMVFIPTMGEYVIPDLLGGAKNLLIGNLITEQFLKARDWPFGAALSVALVFILTLFSLLLLKNSEKEKI